jgi:hypothetical protein
MAEQSSAIESNGSVRVVITTRSDASGARAVIFGGRTPGITFPRTDCDVVALNVDPSADRPDRGFPTPYSLGLFRGLRSVFFVRNTTIRQLRRRGDSVAVIGFGVLFCGDL